jgi:cell division protein FtsZ
LIVRKPQPIQKVEENNAYAELTKARDIKVNQPVEFVPVTEVDRGIIKYSLSTWKLMMILKVLNQLSTTRGGSCRAKHHNEKS